MRRLRAVALAAPVLAALACGGGRSDASTPAGGADEGAGGGDGTSAACSSTLVGEDGELRFTEECNRDGAVTSRRCTVPEDGDAWTCTCSAPSRPTSTCTAPAEPGVITPPAQCCPAP